MERNVGFGLIIAAIVIVIAGIIIVFTMAGGIEGNYFREGNYLQDYLEINKDGTFLSRETFTIEEPVVINYLVPVKGVWEEEKKDEISFFINIADYQAKSGICSIEGNRIICGQAIWIKGFGKPIYFETGDWR